MDVPLETTAHDAWIASIGLNLSNPWTVAFLMFIAISAVASIAAYGIKNPIPPTIILMFLIPFLAMAYAFDGYIFDEKPSAMPFLEAKPYNGQRHLEVGTPPFKRVEDAIIEKTYGVRIESRKIENESFDSNGTEYLYLRNKKNHLLKCQEHFGKNNGDVQHIDILCGGVDLKTLTTK